MANLAGVPMGTTVHLDVTHTGLRRRFVQIRFDLHDTVNSVKEQLQQRTGTPAGSMKLQLFDAADRLAAEEMQDDRPLGFYSVSEGFRIHILDMDPASMASKGWLDDTSLVAKYEISEERYNQREDTARKFKEQLFELRPDLIPQKEVGPDYMADVASHIKVGSRCQVDPGERRGEVKFVGPVQGLSPGYWVGVSFDEPVGKHNGSFEGKLYFECPVGHGVFLRPDKVEVGSFPERDPFAEDEEPDEI